MKKGIFDRRIPTLFAIFFLLIVVGVSTLLIQSGIFYVGKAAPDTQPLNFSITNVSDTSFTATFTTTGLVDAIVSMSGAQTGNTLILDDRDKKTGTQNKYNSHHITIPNLTPSTKYDFKLIVGGKEYSDPLYSATTGTKITTAPPSQNPLFGKVLLPDGTPGSDTIILANSNTSNRISAVSDQNGEFILPTNSLRTAQSNGYVALSEDEQIRFNLFRQAMTAAVTATFKVAQNLPTVTLLQNYTFKKSPVVEEEQQTTSELSYDFSDSGGPVVSIRKPSEGEEFIDPRPLFSGTSFPNSSIDVQIAGVTQQQILTKADGGWTFQSPNNIPQGNHTFIISVTGQNNQKFTDSRRFTIFPFGSQVTESATPSATATPTQKPTAVPTLAPTSAPTPTIIVTPSTAILSPTPAVLPTATPTLLPTIFFTPTNTPTIAPPGVLENTAALAGFSVVLIIAGLALLLIL